jgi:hypothetical protein
LQTDVGIGSQKVSGKGLLSPALSSKRFFGGEGDILHNKVIRVTGGER